MSLSVRPASQNDSLLIVHVIRTVYDEYGFTWDEEDYHADLYDLEGYYLRNGGFWVALQDGAVIGTSGLKFFDPLTGSSPTTEDAQGHIRLTGCDCSLDRLYVLPACRRLGAASALLRKVLCAAGAAGRTRMEIWSDKRFLDAHRLYQRIGAEVVADRISHDPDASPEWGLALKIEPCQE
ncbi:MAG TPA: GNAT family N-acetyltransferase [Chthonomonadales bacterium]|nr:GNAT family N-acetyltransferase [Chthonomonadales bacterium]